MTLTTDWQEVRFNGNVYEVKLEPETGHHIVVVQCCRRDTGVEFTRTIKLASRNWKQAVKLAVNR